MHCDLETGICGVVEDEELTVMDFSFTPKKVDMYYVTDPICSHCWALEPVLRKFLHAYGHAVNFHIVMGGLLEKWDGFADRANGIQQPADVADHWREVGEHSRMPIDGSLWKTNPIHSSFIPSRVFKTIQKRNPSLAEHFLRRARVALFPNNENIAADEVLIRLVNELQLDGDEIVKESKSDDINRELYEDFSLASKLGVRGFPSIVFINEKQKGIKIVGARSFEQYVEALQTISEQPISEEPLLRVEQLFQNEGLLFSKELEQYYDIQADEVEVYISQAIGEKSFVKNKVFGENSFTLLTE